MVQVKLVDTAPPEATSFLRAPSTPGTVTAVVNVRVSPGSRVPIVKVWVWITDSDGAPFARKYKLQKKWRERPRNQNRPTIVGFADDGNNSDASPW